MFVVGHMLHASCPWGPATAHGVGTLTEMDTCQNSGPLVYLLQQERWLHMNGQKESQTIIMDFTGMQTSETCLALIVT